MAFKFEDRVWETTAAGGTAAFRLNGALTAYQTFLVSGFADGDTCKYCAFINSQWEIGTGTYVAATNQLQRSPDSVSSGDTSPVNFLSAPEVICDFSALCAQSLINSTSGQVLTSVANALPTWQTPTTGTVTSVGLALDSSVFTISGSPVTSTGTLTGSLNTQSANTIWAGPATGSPANPTFRALTSADIPSLSGTYLPLAGGTMAGNIAMGGNSLTGAGQVTVTPSAVVTISTDAAQASGGSVTLPFVTVSGIVAGQIVAGTNIPLGDQVSAVIGTVQRTLVANGVSASGQKVLTTTNTTNAVVGMVVYDTTTPAAVGAGNTIASIQAGVSITLTNNLTGATVNGDNIVLDPVVTLTLATSTAVAAGTSITFTANATVLSTSSSIYTKGDASITGNLNVGGTIIGGLGNAFSASGGGTAGVAVGYPGLGLWAPTGNNSSLGFIAGGSSRGLINFQGLLISNSGSVRTVMNGTATPWIEGSNNSATVGNNSVASLSYRASTTTPAMFILAQSNSSTIGTQTAVASGTRLGDINIEGSDGTNFQDAVSLRGLCDGTVSAGVVPGRFEIRTSNASGVMTLAATYDSSQNATFASKIISGAAIRLTGYTVATLPTGTTGDTAYVTDALAPTFLATIVGGGAITTPVFYNGSNWVGG